MFKIFFCALLVSFAMTLAAEAADKSRRVVIYEGAATEVGPAFDQSPELWVTIKDLKRATGFVVKPQGVCRDELCFPIPAGRKKEFIAKKASTTWFNLTEFARLLGQPVAYDDKHSVWYFGPRPEARNEYLATLEAPQFKLPDMAGRMHSLSDFRGKKVLLITWASW
jgi:hypothetical protein